ncbi:MAG: VWA domain-containing protein [Woeseiaceae bacterium]
MARKRQPSQIIGMSFLDVMSCGLGAVVLFFMIINAQVKETTDADNSELMAQTTRLEYEVLDGRKNLVLARNTMEKLEDEKVRAEGQIAQIIALLEQLKAELSKYDKDTMAKIERIEKLQSDIEVLEKEKERLLALAEEQDAEGTKVRAFRGIGDRQYLTGLKVGGDRVLILVDNSASMLDSKLVNIIRRRNMADRDKLRAVKWRQAVASVDWLTTQISPEAKFQIYVFNTEARPIVKGSDGVWLNVDDGNQIEEAIRALRRAPPQNGTNMHAAYRVIRQLTPKPDNVILITDSLPTMREATTSRRTISARDRFALHSQAVREIPSGVPVNTLLFPMEGDYDAAVAYWALAHTTGGSFVSVSRDWP